MKRKKDTKRDSLKFRFIKCAYFAKRVIYWGFLVQLFLMTTIDIAEKQNKILIYLFTNVISVQIFKGAGIIIFLNILINVYNHLSRCFVHQ